jgi:hypothetical protein
MKKCRNCGGENTSSEVYCDWCGEFLPTVEKVTIFSFIRNYFHSFAVLGIFGAIIFYIANLLNNSANSDNLNSDLFGITLKIVLQVGLFICFIFFILLLGLLIVELLKISKKEITNKILLFLLIYFWIFSILLFLIIGKMWLNLIILAIVANIVFILYMSTYDNVLRKFTEPKKTNKLDVIFGAGTLILTVILLYFSSTISQFINISKTISLPFETKPILLWSILDGGFSGILIGLFVGLIYWTVSDYFAFGLMIKEKIEKIVLRGK